MQPDSEHEQDDADPGELGGQPGVGDESGRERAHGDSGEEIADERRRTEPCCREAVEKGEAETHGDRRQQGGFMSHRGPASRSGHESWGADGITVLG